MQMIDVLTKLAALDSSNPTISNPLAAGQKVFVEGEQIAQLPELKDLSTLKALSGLKPVNECGPMGMMDSGMEHRTPASFSINASAADGDEVASMLSQIMNLAGVHKVGAEHMPNVDSGARPLVAEPAEKDIMRSAMDAMNDPEPEDEGAIGGGIGAGIGAALGGPVGAMAGGAMGGSMEDEAAGEPAGGQAEPGTAEPMQSMADEIRGMADKLKDIEDKDQLNLETYDNTPNDPNNAPAYDNNNMSWNPNAGGANKGVTNQPSAMSGMTLEDQLYAEYKNFVNESEQKTMSRAAKGMMKYGKEGMKALAKAGKEGKDLDKVRDKYNKYDEAYNPNSAGAEHARELKAHHKKELEKAAATGDEKAKAALKRFNDRQEAMRQAYYDRMERESVEYDEAYNPNSSAAQHARDMKDHTKKELEKAAATGDEKAKARLKRFNDRQEAMRQAYNDRMDR